MPTIKELRHRRGQIQHELQGILNTAEKESRDLSAEEDQKFKSLCDEDTGIRTKIDRQEHIDRIAADLRESRSGAYKRSEFPPGSAVGDEPNEDDDPRFKRGQTPSEEVRCLVFSAWVRRQSGIALTRDMRQACKSVRFNPSVREFSAPIHRTQDFRALQREFQRRHHMRLGGIETRDVSTGGSAAPLVPAGFINSLEIAMLTHGPMLQVAEVIVTDKGNDLPWPTADDTGNEGEIIGQAASVGDSVDPTFDKATLKAFKFSSKLIKVSTETIEDSAFDLPSLLGNMEGERIGRRMNRAFTVGVGTTEPLGIVTAATVGKEAATDNAITAEELMDLFHSVDPAYRESPGTAWMFHDSIIAVIRKLKGQDGHFLWQPGLQEGVPDRLMQKPVRVNNHMADHLEVSAKVALFGDLAKYKVRLVRTTRQRRLVERFADTDQEGFIAFQRADGTLLDAGTSPVKALQMAAASG